MPADLPARLAEISRKQRLHADPHRCGQAYRHGKGALMGLGGSSGGQQPVTQQTTQTRDPWSAAQPYLATIMGNASGLYAGDVGYHLFRGNTTASLNPYITSAMGNINALATSEPQGSTALQGARGYLSDLVSNQGLSAPLQNIASTLANQQNPYLQDTLNQQMSQVNSAMSGA